MVMMKKTAESFANLCISAYECWQMYKIMCEYNIADKSGIWARFGTIFPHSVILHIAKINDPKKYGHGEDYNLSLAYFVACVVNKPSYTDSYNKFLKDNGDFIEAIKKARDKVVAHPDLKVYISDDVVGVFSTDLGKKYFDSLHEIISEGYIELGLDFFPEWPQFIVDDTKIFMNKILKVFDTQHSS